RRLRAADHRVTEIEKALLSVTEERRRAEEERDRLNVEQVALQDALRLLAIMRYREELRSREVALILCALAAGLVWMLFWGEPASWNWQLKLAFAAAPLASCVTVVGALRHRKWTYALTVAFPALFAAVVVEFLWRPIPPSQDLLLPVVASCFIPALVILYESTVRLGGPSYRGGSSPLRKAGVWMVLGGAALAVLGGLVWTISEYYRWTDFPFVLLFACVASQTVWEPEPEIRRVAASSVIVYVVVRGAAMYQEVLGSW